jgi:hypothetical protein
MCDSIGGGCRQLRGGHHLWRCLRPWGYTASSADCDYLRTGCTGCDRASLQALLTGLVCGQWRVLPVSFSMYSYRVYLFCLFQYFTSSHCGDFSFGLAAPFLGGGGLHVPVCLVVGYMRLQRLVNSQTTHS